MPVPRTAITPRLAGQTVTVTASPATVAFATGTVTVAGLQTDMQISYNVTSATAGIIVNRVWVSAANTLSVQVYNTTATDPLATTVILNIVGL